MLPWNVAPPAMRLGCRCGRCTARADVRDRRWSNGLPVLLIVSISPRIHIVFACSSLVLIIWMDWSIDMTAPIPCIGLWLTRQQVVMSRLVPIVWSECPVRAVTMCRPGLGEVCLLLLEQGIVLACSEPPTHATCPVHQVGGCTAMTCVTARTLYYCLLLTSIARCSDREQDCVGEHKD